ncbi:MAG: bifunctional glycosyltransferase/class I SAM-dependent methyltransferase [Opitutaceae bacterium]|nr:bifunctional glycosyltransferase/class I SAM-dependent methyltransferase [Opitutaceae bacterium]
MTPDRPPRVLIFIVAYYAEATILDVLRRIPALEGYAVEVLIIDDGSTDATFALADRLRRAGSYRHPLTVLANPVNQGYGGNQKLGYHYAIEHDFDHVVLVHGDGQYAPELLPEILAPLARGEADVVFGSRMMIKKNALRGGMPGYKFIGNQMLTWYQNRVLQTRLSEFHSGYKACSVSLLRRLPFDLNSNVFHFDTEIIIQFLRARARILEIPIPTHYGDEISRVNGLRYALDVMNASTVARLMNYGLVYRRNFDLPAPENRHYLAKLGFLSTHSAAIEEVPAGATVLDIGCGPGHLSPALRERRCRIIGVDQFSPADPAAFDEFHVADLNANPVPRPLDEVQVVLVLDIIEHLASPEKFCDTLRQHAQSNLGVKIVISTGNVGFFVTRFMLFLGQFNYSTRGILDQTHTRLFTFSSLRRLLKETGFVIERERGIPAPVPLVVKSPFWQNVLMQTQGVLMRVSRGLFAYQMFVVARALPTLPTLMRDARRHSAARTDSPAPPAPRS